MTVEETIKKQNDISNITEWHENGITGKGISVWNCENSSGHGAITGERIKTSAPGANIYWGYIQSNLDKGEIKSVSIATDAGDEYSPEEWLSKYNIKVASRSMKHAFAGEDKGAWRELWEGLQKKYNLVIFDAADNEGEEQTNYHEGYDIALTVGAVHTNLKPTNYTSVTDDVDFADFTGVWNGTSFSCPYLAGKAALILERYGDMSQTEIFKYFKMCALDVHEEGEDNKTGWGVVVLPKFEKKYITMTTKEKTYHVDGKTFEMDTKPVNIDGRVFVPVRVISEALGGEVSWEFNSDKSIKVLIDKGNAHIELNTGNDIAIINGKKEILDVAPFIDENNRTLVPIRFIAETFGCQVDWIQKEAKVMILEQ